MSRLTLPEAISPLRCWSVIWPQLTELSPTLNPVQRLVDDSRQIEPGDAFFALRGVQQSGQDYQDEALRRGASLLIKEGPLCLQAVSPSAWLLQLPDLQARLGELLTLSAKVDYSQLNTAAVTGTNGKSSVAHYLCQLRQLLGQKAVLVGTLGYGALDNLQPASHTTPDLLQLHQMYLNWLQQGVGYVCLEASSHALDQGRLDGLPLTTAIFTNLTRDHLDYHRSLEAYAQAKSLLFQRPEVSHHVINLDDPQGRKLLSQSRPAAKISYSLTDPGADLSLVQPSYSLQGVEAHMRWQGQLVPFSSPLLGHFNLANILAAVAVLLAEGEPLEKLLPLLAQVRPVKGRMQRLNLAAEVDPSAVPSVVVDYAHTPDALKQALYALRLHAQGRIFCVFGCGGNRDQGKRALMAQVAREAADSIIVTDDNPRDEDPAAIRQELLAAAPEAKEIAGRAEAIAWAIQEAQAGDWVLIAGKGHEDYQEIAGQRFAFDDQKVAEQALHSLKGVTC